MIRTGFAYLLIAVMVTPMALLRISNSCTSCLDHHGPQLVHVHHTHAEHAEHAEHGEHHHHQHDHKDHGHACDGHHTDHTAHLTSDQHDTNTCAQLDNDLYSCSCSFNNTAALTINSVHLPVVALPEHASTQPIFLSQQLTLACASNRSLAPYRGPPLEHIRLQL